MDSCLPIVTDIFGASALAPHSILYTGVAIFVTHSPLHSRLVTASVGSGAGWCPARGTVSLSQDSGLRVCSRTGACKWEGRVTQEAPGSKKGQKAARA